MKTIYKTLLFVSVAVLCFASCRKEVEDKLVNPNDRICKTYLQQFEAIWNGMD